MRNGIILACQKYVNKDSDNTWLKMTVQESEDSARIIHYPLGAVSDEYRDEVEDKPSLLVGMKIYFTFLPVGAKLAGSDKPVETADKFVDLSQSMLAASF